MVKRFLSCIFIILLIVNLTGCGYLTGRTSSMVTAYNTQINETKSKYDRVKVVADTNKKVLYAYLLSAADNAMGKTFEDSLDSTIMQFKETDIVKDIYFTALGAECIREVVVLKGDIRVYVEVIWGTEGIISMTRRVV